MAIKGDKHRVIFPEQGRRIVVVRAAQNRKFLADRLTIALGQDRPQTLVKQFKAGRTFGDTPLHRHPARGKQNKNRDESNRQQQHVKIDAGQSGAY